ncbi:hypothetical protein [Noviherbaspirillum massiliense]|uniref:hypothetical protein n=1 Tax=Noviherbaspirillum massiliense TaxID=1465823 RepID=UPI0002E9C2D6|nr:hypothetical protein [Noviherbaspirillum massiliense]
MGSWKPVGVVVEGESLFVDGIDVWNSGWTRADQPAVSLAHPSYVNQMHEMPVYQISEDGKTITFACTEVSANVYAFYVPV